MTCLPSFSERKKVKEVAGGRLRMAVNPMAMR